MFKHVHYPQSRRSLASEDGSQKSAESSASVSDGSSRSSSALSAGETQTGVIKVFCNVLRPDIEYKTLFVSTDSSTRDVVRMLLQKCKMRNRDPNLYYLTMDIVMQQQSGAPLKTVLVLDEDARPLELKTCQPSGYLVKYTLHCRQGGLVKIHDACLNSNSQYKSLLISQQTMAEDVIQLLLHCHDSMESSDNFALFEVSHMPHYHERKLHPEDRPLLVCQHRQTDPSCSLHLRRIDSLPLPKSASLPFLPQETISLPWFSGSHDMRLKPKISSEQPLTCLLEDINFSNYQNYVYI